MVVVVGRVVEVVAVVVVVVVVVVVKVVLVGTTSVKFFISLKYCPMRHETVEKFCPVGMVMAMRYP